MEPKAHHIVIGFFTLAAVVAALLFALWLGKTSTNTEWAYYQIGFDHPVGGLSRGNPVLYSGIPVGDVQDLELAPDNPAHVRVLVRIKSDIPVRKNTRVELVLANITGSMSIQFSGGTPDSPVLTGTRTNPPFIQAEPSTLSNLLSNSESLLTQADQLLSNANALLAADNLENVATILENARKASESLVANQEQFLEVVEQFNEAGVRTQEAAIKVSGAADRASEVLGDDVKPVLTATTRAIATLQPTLDRIERLTANNEQALDHGLQGLGELNPTLRELRSTLRNLNSFTRKLEQEPARTLWGGDDMKEFEQ